MLLVLTTAPAHAARPLNLGFFDGGFAAGDTQRLDDAVRAGGRTVRIPVTWAVVAPKRPAAPRNPADPAYAWAGVDAAVAAAQQRGLRVLLSPDRAPRWAEGAGRRTPGILEGSWKPSPSATGDFVQALASRYPQVRHIQLWNEPNLPNYLAPQWRKGKPFAAVRYRKMLNAAYAGLRRAGTGARLVTAGTAPYGDPERGGRRIRPARFWRAVLGSTVRFDILAHHPYAVDGPRRKAYGRDDVAVPDVHKLVRLTRRAVRAGKLLPRARKRFWVTEMSWDSSPPDPQGVPEARHARWLADAFYVLWKQGVDTILWFQTRDQAPVPSYAATNQSGVFFRDGTPKLAARAFRFPLACERRGSRTRVWTLAPRSGTVQFMDADGRVLRRISTDAAAYRHRLREPARRDPRPHRRSGLARLSSLTSGNPTVARRGLRPLFPPGRAGAKETSEVNRLKTIIALALTAAAMCTAVAAAATFTGTAGPDFIFGTPQNDTISGLGGDDPGLGASAATTPSTAAAATTSSTVTARAPRAPRRTPTARPEGPAAMTASSAAPATTSSTANGADRFSGQGGDDRLRAGAGTTASAAARASTSSPASRAATSSPVAPTTTRSTVAPGATRCPAAAAPTASRGGSGNDRIRARDKTRDRINCGKGKDR